ncbi:MAG TPA: response regulator [Clostridiaceae bacterium]
MLKVLIVDDEPMVREGLKSIIQWEENGFYICGEGIDGRDGLNKIIELEPDLVLMDIRMPGIHGIELISEARSRGFKGKIIILTGYSDFGYAQSAIRLEVNDYLLKPIDEEELIRSITNISKAIQEESEVQICINDSKNNKRNNAITNIVLGREFLSELDGDLEAFNLNFKFDSYQVVLFDIALRKSQGASKIELDKKFESTYITLKKNLMSQFANNEDIEMFNQESRFGLIFKGKANILKAPEILKRLYKQWLEGYGVNTFITLGNVVKSIEDISISYSKAKEVLKKRFFYEEDMILSWDELSTSEAKLFEDTETKNMDFYIDKIYTFVEVDDMDNINSMFNEIGHIFKKLNYSSEKLKGLCINIFIEFKEKIILNYKELKEDFSPNEDIVQNIYDQGSLNELIEYLKGECVAISSKICNSSSDNTIKRILAYVQKNYYKDLKLRLLAEIFNYNSSYLGKMFKSYTGEEFYVYLDKIRIENTKTLLNENILMVYEVAEKVGYKNVDYFSSKFKKYVGVTPNEYKRLYK